MNDHPIEGLAARVEALSAGDREIDAEIAVAVDGGEIVWLQANGTMESYPARKYQSASHVGGFGKAPVPAYTSSIDTALALLPSYLFPTIDFVTCRVWLRNSLGFDVDRTLHGFGKTVPLSLCAAALRARTQPPGLEEEKTMTSKREKG